MVHLNLFSRYSGSCFFVLLLFCFFISISASAQKKNKRKSQKARDQQGIVLAEDKVSPYRIVIPAAGTTHELKAAKVLQDYLIQISGAALPIITADKPRSRYEIVLG